MERKIRLNLSYDGTDFAGWQTQNSERTVQAELEKALTAVLGHSVSATGSGRTDSGVHASQQVVHFVSDNPSIPPGRYRDAVNAHLPRDIRVLSSVEVPEAFHARYDARIRVYRYQILNDEAAPAYFDRYCYLIRRPLSVLRLNSLAAPLSGVHDFTTFAAAGDVSKSKVREIFSASFYREGPFLIFRIAGNAFLWKMVRSILGTILEMDKQGGSPEDMRKALDARDRLQAGTTAPARGLFLHRVLYDTERTLY